MKTLTLLLTLANLATHAQAVLRVNNTPGVNAPYTTIAAAVTAAGPDDIIIVEGSNANYGDIIINKKVTIIGPGYFHEQHGLQATFSVAAINTIALNSGANGSSFEGLYVPASPGITLNNVSNISISGSYIAGSSPGCNGIVLNGTGNNIVIKNNYIRTIFSGGCGGGGSVNCTGSFTQVLVNGNHLGGRFFTGPTSSFIITNNTFDDNFNSIQNSVIQNNIFARTLTALNIITGSTTQNNLFVAPQPGVDATNLVVAQNSLFEGISSDSNGFVYDSVWKLKVGSPAIGFGLGGTDCGMYGGTSPYRPSGIAVGRHTINSLTVPATVTQGQNLNVRVGAKVN